MKYILIAMLFLSTNTSLANTTKELIWIQISKDNIQNKLKDPSSAKFRNVFFNCAANNVPVVCGEVNSKNSFGGYAGYQRFVAAGEKLAYLEEDIAGDFDDVWKQLCTKG